MILAQLDQLIQSADQPYAVFMIIAFVVVLIIGVSMIDRMDARRSKDNASNRKSLEDLGASEQTRNSSLVDALREITTEHHNGITKVTEAHREGLAKLADSYQRGQDKIAERLADLITASNLATKDMITLHADSADIKALIMSQSTTIMNQDKNIEQILAYLKTEADANREQQTILFKQLLPEIIQEVRKLMEINQHDRTAHTDSSTTL